MGAKVIPLRPPVSGEQLSDEALLAACALADRAALGELFDRHAGAVFRFAAHLGLDRAQAEDVVQELFTSLPRLAPRFRGGSAVRTFLLGVSRNLVRRAQRRRSQDARLALALPAQDRASPALDDEVAQRRRLERLQAALAGLSPKLRETFVLVYVEGLSGQEVALALGIREGAVWKQLFDARKKLKEIMGAEP